jgi:hypothetical protein
MLRIGSVVRKEQCFAAAFFENLEICRSKFIVRHSTYYGGQKILAVTFLTFK